MIYYYYHNKNRKLNRNIHNYSAEDRIAAKCKSLVTFTYTSDYLTNVIHHDNCLH